MQKRKLPLPLRAEQALGKIWFGAFSFKYFIQVFNQWVWEALCYWFSYAIPRVEEWGSEFWMWLGPSSCSPDVRFGCGVLSTGMGVCRMTVLGKWSSTTWARSLCGGGCAGVTEVLLAEPTSTRRNQVGQGCSLGKGEGAWPQFLFCVHSSLSFNSLCWVSNFPET